MEETTVENQADFTIYGDSAREQAEGRALEAPPSLITVGLPRRRGVVMREFGIADSYGKRYYRWPDGSLRLKPYETNAQTQVDDADRCANPAQDYPPTPVLPEIGA